MRLTVAAILCVMAFGSLAVCSTAEASVPDVVPFQALIRDSQGDFIPANTAVEFRIYSAETAGSLLWGPETHTVTPVDGVVSVLLGSSGHPVGASAFAGDAYLEIKVAAQSPLPRIRIGSTAYAFRSARAADADSLGGIPSHDYAATTHGHSLDDLTDVAVGTPGEGQVLTYTGGVWRPTSVSGGADQDWTVNGANMYTHASVTGNVGVGTTNPARKLDVSGDIHASGDVYEGSTKLADKYVNEGQPGSIATGMLANGAVDSTKIAAGAVGRDQISSDAVNSSKIEAGSVGTSDIADYAVTNPKIANDAVVSGQIADGSVGNEDLGANAVTSDKILDGGVTVADMGPGTLAGAGYGGGGDPNVLYSLTSSGQSFASGTITAPAPGYVIVTGCANLFVTHVSGTWDNIIMKLSPAAGDVDTPSFQARVVRVPSEWPSGSYHYCVPISITAVYNVDPGVATFHLNGYDTRSSGNDSVLGATVSVVYVPLILGSMAADGAGPRTGGQTDRALTP